MQTTPAFTYRLLVRSLLFLHSMVWDHHLVNGKKILRRRKKTAYTVSVIWVALSLPRLISTLFPLRSLKLMLSGTRPNLSVNCRACSVFSLAKEPKQTSQYVRKTFDQLRKNVNDLPELFHVAVLLARRQFVERFSRTDRIVGCLATLLFSALLLIFGNFVQYLLWAKRYFVAGQLDPAPVFSNCALSATCIIGSVKRLL